MALEGALDAAGADLESRLTAWAGRWNGVLSHHHAPGILAWAVTGSADDDGAARESFRSEFDPALAGLHGVAQTAFVTGPAAAPGPKAFAFDVDSTLIEEEVIELLAARAGSLEEVASVTAAAMRGELDFAASLTRRVATLRGLETSALGEVAAQVTPTTGAVAFIRRAVSGGHAVGAVSGGFEEVLAPHSAEWGLTAHLANALETEDGRLTGRVTGEIVTAETKRRFLLSLGDETTRARIAVGDGANDLEMVRAADVGVALCAKPVLAEAADVRLDVRHLGALEAIVCMDA
ncbi:hypothetical protein GCM10009595_06140 [Falsarthrobacter nasiphocae]